MHNENLDIQTRQVVRYTSTRASEEGEASVPGLKLITQRHLDRQLARLDAIHAQHKFLICISTRPTNPAQLPGAQQQQLTYLERARRLKGERGHLVAAAVPYIKIEQIAPAVIEDLDDGDGVFLERGVGQALDGFVGAVARVVDGAGDVLDVLVDLLFVGG